MSALLEIQDVTKVYGTAKNPIQALGPVSLTIEPKTMCVILGRSGSGKSTLLNLMAGLDTPTAGKIRSDNIVISAGSRRELAAYRSTIGIIFQFYNLLPSLNTLENVLMGAWAAGKKVSESKGLQLLERFGLSHRVKADVRTLSGGEKQRVAICRALVGDPGILFCDEPTGALDSQNEVQVMDILRSLNQQDGLTIIMVTHNPEFASMAKQVVYMQDGQINQITNSA